MDELEGAQGETGPEAREELARQWGDLVGSLRAFFQRRLPDAAAVEDTLQECFVRALEGVDKLEIEGSFSAWIYRIARNLVNDVYRARDRECSSDVESVPSRAQEENLTRTVAGWLAPVIEELPSDQREILRAFELEGRSQREIADGQGLTVAAVKARVRRGRRQIRERLLACCAIEFDRSGRVLDYARRAPGSCGPDC